MAEQTEIDRQLTDEEKALIEWILENGGPEGEGFMDQLARARVTGVCTCGCASIRLKVDGLPEAPPGVHELGDFVFDSGSELCGIFVYSSDGILSGLEVYGLDGDAPATLPMPSELRPFAGYRDTQSSADHER